MKVLVLLGVIFITGCGSMRPLEQLEQQAFLTGDWSEVEKRERIIARRLARKGMHCPAGQVSFCEKRVGQSRCGCISNDEMRSALAWR
jgi:hypothetical protein